MDERTIGIVRDLLSAGRPEEALTRLAEERAHDPGDWNAPYLAAFAWRSLGRLPEAIDACRHALQLNPGEPHIHLNLGVCYQQSANYPEAIACFEKVLEMAPDLILAYNTLGLTLRMAGRPEEALKAYDRGLDALFSAIYSALQNSPESPLVPFRDTRGEFWREKALAAAVYYAGEEGLERLGWPTGADAEGELDTSHGGLYYVDASDDDGSVRYLLPNYFHKMREALGSSVDYSMFLSNMGGILAAAGDTAAARARFAESIEFIPAGLRFESPHDGLRALQ